MSRFDAIAGRLESLLEDLDELALDQLREALADGATERPTTDKELAKARRAVDKAARIVRALDDQN